MARKLTADFYRVDVSGGFNFQRLLADVYALPPEERNRTGISSPIRLQEYTRNGDVMEGDMLKIRMDEVPIKASLYGSTRFIDLNDDEGIGEETAFYYYAPWRVLLLQRNRHAVSASAFTWYFNHIADDGPIIGLIPILRSDVLQRLARMTIMRKLDVRIAGIENAEIFRGEGYGVGAIIDLKEAFSAPNVLISVSMGRRRGSLLVERVRETITGLLRVSGHGDRRLKKLAVEAQEDYTHTPELLDILKSRIIEEIEIDPTVDRRLPYERRKEALREVFSRRRTELRQMFG